MDDMAKMIETHTGIKIPGIRKKIYSRKIDEILQISKGNFFCHCLENIFRQHSFIFSPAVLCSLAATYSSRGGALAGTVGTYAIPAVFAIYLTLGVLIRFKLSQSEFAFCFVWLLNNGPNQMYIWANYLYF
jgi:hypothetical protein